MSQWAVEWNWPKPTNSYRLEAEGYALIQNQVRFSTAVWFDPNRREDHNMFRRLHKAGRLGIEGFFA